MKGSRRRSKCLPAACNKREGATLLSVRSADRVCCQVRKKGASPARMLLWLRASLTVHSLQLSCRPCHMPRLERKLGEGSQFVEPRRGYIAPSSHGLRCVANMYRFFLALHFRVSFGERGQVCEAKYLSYPRTAILHHRSSLKFYNVSRILLFHFFESVRENTKRMRITIHYDKFSSIPPIRDPLSFR